MALKSVSMQQSGGGNPFGGGAQQTTALTTGGQTVGVPLKLPNGTTIMLASQADAQTMQAWWAAQKQAVTSLDGGSTGSGSSGGDGINRALGMAADGAQALSGFLQGRDFASKLNEYHDAQDAIDTLREEFARSSSTAPVTAGQVMRMIDAQQDLADSQAAVLETLITGVDIQAGAGAAKVVGRFLNGDSGMGGGMGSGATTALAVGGVGLGALLLSRNNNNNDRTSRRRR